ncbi:hypothetical protein ACFHWD_20205 [Clostridium sp. MT-14]|jgi:hypothetical protein|uniref:Uncharacterized protein n=1 Tax=Clostridium aromativorans TaxID=2836848 RepID=A0ABS8NCB1_9CLOT|nr:hypothetical protein [Clostridium aromativorans]MCC9296834.1 hypothetical protein [Clostridium aromativorans]CAB1249470.1 conserved hypothetical protein [Clostridiaceae bacterium BL-3]
MSKEERIEYIDTFFELNSDVETREMIDMIKSLERFRMFLYKNAAEHVKLVSSLTLSPEYEKKFRDALKNNWTSEYDGIRIKIYVPEVPPTIYIKTRNEAVGYFMELWKAKTRNVLKGYDIHFEKVFVWLKCYNPVSSYDVDNKFIKPFLDGIRQSGIIKDDNFKIVKYGMEGLLDRENPHMELYIFGDDSIPEFIKKGIF